ncbi:MAG: Rap1a/Tai family immunity protein [Gammaproteobacteria bacterium]|nr:Rap1a/Tai family immunity protein [Gammaproteobacteria bacterium]
MHTTPPHPKTGRYRLLCLIGLLTCAPAWSDTPDNAEVQTITHGMSLAVSCEQALLTLDKRYDKPIPRNDAFICMAYLNGIMAAARHANERARLEFALATAGRGNQAAFRIYCFDWQRSFEKIAGIVLNFAQHNPIYLQRPAEELVMRALQTAFPCR